MSDPLESELRRALRPVPPSDAFERVLMVRLAAEFAAAAKTRRRVAVRWGWFSASLAASVLIGVGVHHQFQSRQRETGLEARRQVIQALRLTHQKLDLAYRVVEGQPPSGRHDASGA